MEIVTLNIVPKGITPVCHASQFDVGRVIRLSIVDELHGYVFTDEDVELRVRKPDDNVVTASVEVTSGNAYVDIVTTEQMTACEGVNKCELRITKGGVRIGSLNFDMKVEVDPLKDGIESETEIHNLETQIRDMNEEMLPDMVAEEVANQYDSQNVIFDDHPIAGHGIGYVVKSENVPDELNDLDDVNISGAAQGEALVWNGAEWVNGTVSTVGSIDDLNDVDTTGKANADSLRYNATAQEWEAKPTTVEMTLAEYTALGGDYSGYENTNIIITDAPNLNATAQDISYDGSATTTKQKINEALTAITPIYLSTIGTGTNISFISNASYRVGNMVVLNCILKVTGNLANNATILSNIPKNGANAPIRFLRVVGSDVYYGHDDNAGGFNIDANATSLTMFGALTASAGSPKYLFVNLAYICSNA